MIEQCFVSWGFVISQQLFVDSLSSEISLLCLHSDMSVRCSTKRFYLIFLAFTHFNFCYTFDCVRNSCIRLSKEREREKEREKRAKTRDVFMCSSSFCKMPLLTFIFQRAILNANQLVFKIYILSYHRVLSFFLIYRYCNQEAYLKHFLLLTVTINYRYFLNEASIVRLFANISNHYHEISLCLLLVCTLAVTNYFIIVVQETLNPKSSVSLSKP